MSDYIDRQAAIDALGMAIDVDDFRTATGLIHEATVSKVLDCIPAADVVPVVRCKDCKYYEGRHWCGLNETNFDPDAFCSYGEMREDTSNG